MTGAKVFPSLIYLSRKKAATIEPVAASVANYQL